jgi:KaiC/GvpD/RAD55 family RecA-like ATPase
MSMFKKAVKAESKLRLSIAGPSGSGKTYTSLAIAEALANGKPVAVVDTEHGSASKYADIFAFDVAEMHPPFHPDKYIKTIAEAADAGYAVIVLDSMTHAWEGTGGVLDLVDEAAKRSQSKNSYTAWKEGTPVQNALIEAIVTSSIHVITTVRSKMDYVQEKDRNNNTVIKKVGMAPVQRNGWEYEFDVVLDMDVDHNAIVSKTRCPALSGRVFSKPGRDVANILAEWLRGEPAPQPHTVERKEPPTVTTTTTTPPPAGAAANGTTTGIVTTNGSANGAGHVEPRVIVEQTITAAVNATHGDNWGDWTTADDNAAAYQWAKDSGKFGADKHLSNAWTLHMKTWRGKNAADMLAAWREYVNTHEPAQPADVPAMADVPEMQPA